MISRFEFFLRRRLRLCDSLSDEEYLRCRFRHKKGYTLDLEHPVTFNEKLQWLKLHDRKDIYTTMVDKYAVKDYAAGIIGDEYIIPTLGVWDSFDEIDFDSLPEQFVLKCTHDSGGLVICKDKSRLNIGKARKRITKRLGHNYYYLSREWPYKNVKPRIIAEQYLEDRETNDLRDYKFFVFDGTARAMLIVSDRTDPKIKTHHDYYDIEFNHLPLNVFENAPVTPGRPEKYDEMVGLAEKLGEGLTHARIDFYLVNGKVYFGEITFYDGGGYDPLVPEKWDRVFGDWIKLPDIKSNR